MMMLRSLPDEDIPSILVERASLHDTEAKIMGLN